ncbi:MAG: hypothetical protein GY859_33835 [Desulfobacterales bacterium]|nr:hypothetical protein [Desulfobacterales bacterium]
MGKLPEIVDQIRLPLEIPIQPHLQDHRFMGRAVLPGVEAMQLLAAAAGRHFPDIIPGQLTDIRFEKFLYIPPGETSIEAFADMETHANGDHVAHLRTKFRSKKTPITRIITHGAARFPAGPLPPHPPCPDVPPPIEGLVVKATPEKIYEELVPFGPAYRNIIAPLILSRDGAVARISGGAAASEAPDAPPPPLGSPFPLDAAFHAACVWGQRFFNLVAFPVGVQTRYIPRPTVAEEDYLGVIIPKQTDPALLVFDIFLYGGEGELFDIALGVHMRDVSGGRLKPPEWISRGVQ